MNYGYPGANSQIENHNVSEESFWPSFTDIMMVIVMVFLLVTVAVILNNWALITKLTTSIEAQEAATLLADDRQEENLNLENKLIQVQQNLLALNNQLTEEKAELAQTQAEFVAAASALTKKEQSLSSIETKLSALNEKYESEQQRLSSTSEQLSASELKLSNTDKELLNIKQQLSNKETIIAALEKKLLDTEQTNADTEKTLEEIKAALVTSEKENATLTEVSKSEIANLNDELEGLKSSSTAELNQLKSAINEQNEKTVTLEKDKESLDLRLAELLKLIEVANASLAKSEETAFNEETKLLQKITIIQKENEIKDQTIEESRASQSELQAQFDDSVTELERLNVIISESEKNVKTIEASVNKSDESLKVFEESLAKAQEELLAKDKIIQELSQAQETGVSQLRSLQGEYDSLDTKYQKLLRPARSSTGKFIASVTYRQVQGKKVIRYKPSPTDSYRTVSESQLESSLTALKEKHKEDLYVKVVIPENSGLSYNEAWKFTINLQRKYDYYYNEEE